MGTFGIQNTKRRLHEPIFIPRWLYTILNSDNDTIATICLRDAEMSFAENIIKIPRAHQNDQAVLYDKDSFIKSIRGKSFLYGYGFAVLAKLARSGLGLTLMKTIENFAKQSSYDGTILETGQEASWLIDWYKKNRFEIFAESDPSLKKIKTVMMIKYL